MTISQSDHCTFCGGTGQRNEHRYDKDHPHERLINEVYRYQAWLFQAWRTIRGQTKGLQRQRRLIKRVQADNAALRADLQEAVKWIPNGILHSANPRLSAIYNRLNAALKEKP